ncbi:MAG: ABC transporter permease [Deltaproteobacteria bacterium]|nr:ABC transporter permease [Deltaproteobacteria bacterium]TLN02811.1 MAG: ABC transporter permease [bacterium]
MPRKKIAKRPKLAREGFSGRIHYFVERAFVNLKQNLLVTLLTIGTITLAFLILSLALLIYVNLERVTENWSDRVQVTAYFEQSLSTSDLVSLKTKIRALEGTADIHYVSQEEALQKFYDRLKGQEALLDGVSPDVLPASLEIQLKKAHRDSESISLYVERLKKIPLINEVQYGEEWVQRFSHFMDLIRFAGLLVAGFIVLAVVFIVANTIKLTIYARKDELELMGLVGATRLFIKIPFLIEGVVQGVIGAALAILFLLGVYLAFLQNADFFFSFNTMEAGLLFLPLNYLVALVSAGAALGFLGSLASLKRFISL